MASDDMTGGEKASMFLGIIAGIILGGLICLMTMGPSTFNNGMERGSSNVRQAGCASACVRRGTEMSHIHDLMCVCNNGHTLTLDYGAMYRPME